jgi:hypothetical protein
MARIQYLLCLLLQPFRHPPDITGNVIGKSGIPNIPGRRLLGWD